MKTLVVGIGNPNFKDDGVGLKIVEELQGVVDTVSLLNISFQIIDSILGYDKVIIVDGVKSGTEPGSIVEFSSDYWANIYASGTHNLSIFEIIRIGYKLFPEEMPKEIKIIGVEVEDVETLSRECSSKVVAAIPEAVARIKEYLNIQHVQNAL
ncbi:MAG TPA: hydrogenase maturation protease [Thermodesulfovibrio thiophilus]|uniref:hydrogenase maturation protease n=1 Tax=Thermodesulfovibrio thiophilus TaxID=340095 RepID=UPI00040D673A|nr:hydrogenase maturation protease [Thermodesulfovibrio thiophilus]HHW20933.1 hydrogenase maturation protease [Thermodesulfovibrio thiophilus]HOA83217.1 hydrogenase maturation protease [Thermodesulfovibrio thiophilus]HQA04238.1 hydrogenase maturation protease [Thermodesulfovibrio thiophilus]HQD36245.1 hydrogenase maturation protease [Thermodesulfovibrio thiophilus]